MNSLKLDGALKILRMLNEDGFEAYIVGGYVRDRILGPFLGFSTSKFGI